MIDRAWNDLPDPDAKFRQAADAADVERTLEFARHAIEVIDHPPPPPV